MMIDGHISPAKVAGRRKQSMPSSRAEARVEATAAPATSLKSESRLNSLGRQLLCGFITGSGSGHHSQNNQQQAQAAAATTITTAPQQQQPRSSFLAQLKSPKLGKLTKQTSPATKSTSNESSTSNRKSLSTEDSSNKNNNNNEESLAPEPQVNIATGNLVAGPSAGSGDHEIERSNLARESEAGELSQCRSLRGGEPARHLVRMMANESFMGANFSCNGNEAQPIGGPSSVGSEWRKVSNNESPRKLQHLPADATDRLIGILDQLTAQRSRQTSADSDDDDVNDDDLCLEDSWCEFIDIEEEATENLRTEWPESLRQQLVPNLRLQQDAIWELLTTEANYIKCLKVIVDTFLLTLDKLRSVGLLLEVEPLRLVSNIEEIYQANRLFWSQFLVPMVQRARETRKAMRPSELLFAFVEIRHLFRPYYRYCLEHRSCLRELKELSRRDDQFKLYLAWCEGQMECERLKLVDLLAKPMQRLTRYSLLLKSIEKRTDDQGECRALEQMLAYTNKFVLTVDLELRQKDELELLISTARRVDSSDCGHFDHYTDEVHQILRSYSQFELLVPMFPAACPFECQRQLLFDSQRLTQGANLGQLRFRDAQSSGKLDIVLLLMTDHLLVCKQTAASHHHLASGLNLNIAQNIIGTTSSTSASAATNQPQQQQSSWWCSQPASVTNSKLQSPSRSANATSSSPTKKLAQAAQQSNSHLSPAAQVSGRTKAFSNQASIDDGYGNSSSRYLDQRDTELRARDTRTRSMSTSTRDQYLARIAGGLGGLVKDERVDVAQQASRQLEQPSAVSQRQSFSHHQTGSNWSLTGAITGHPSSMPRSGDSSSQCNMQQPPLPQQVGQNWPSTFGSHLSIATYTSSDLLGSQLPALKVIRPPYPVERLLMHELRDGLGVVFCQLNDNLTVSNSFVISCSPPNEATRYQQQQLSSANQTEAWSPQSSGKGRGNKTPISGGAGGSHFLRAQFGSSRSDSESLQQLESVATTAASRRSSINSRTASGSQRGNSRLASQTTPARRLVNLVRQAQVRFHLAAYLHQVDVTILSNLLTEKPQQPTQRPTSPRIHHNFSSWSLRSIRSRSASGSNKNRLQKQASRAKVEQLKQQPATHISRHNSFAVPIGLQQDSSDNAHSDTQLDSRRSSRHFTPSIGRRSASSENQQQPGSLEQASGQQQQQQQQPQQSGSNSPNDNPPTRCWPKVEPDPMLKAIMEQHQAFLLSHNQHDILATHEFRYPIFDRNYLHVKPVPYSLAANYSHHNCTSADSASGGHLVDGRESCETVSTVRYQHPGAGASTQIIDPRHLSADYAQINRSGSTRSGSQSSVFYGENSSTPASHSLDHSQHPLSTIPSRQFLSPRLASDYHDHLQHQRQQTSSNRLSARSADIPVVPCSNSNTNNSTSSSARSSPICAKSNPNGRMQPTLSSPHLLHQRQPPMDGSGRYGREPQQQSLGQQAQNPLLTLSSSGSKSRESLARPPQMRPARRNVCLLKRQHVIPSVCCEQELKCLNYKPSGGMNLDEHSSVELNTDTSNTTATVTAQPDDSTSRSSITGNLSGSRRNKFVAQHQRDYRLASQGHRNLSQASTADQTSVTLDDSSVEMFTMDQSVEFTRNQCARCNVERNKQASVSFELGNLGHRKLTPGVDTAYLCTRHECLSGEQLSIAEHSGPRSTSMESARSPVAVTLTFDDDGRESSNLVDSCTTTTTTRSSLLSPGHQNMQHLNLDHHQHLTPSVFLSIPRNVQTRRSFAGQGDSSYLSANRCKSLSPIHSSCASPQGTVTPQRSQATTENTWLGLNSELDKCSSAANSAGSLNTPSIASNSPNFLDSDLDQSFEDQDSSRNNSSSSNPVHRRRVPLLNITSASPQAMDRSSYDFLGSQSHAADMRRLLALQKPNSMGHLERSGCRSSNSSDGDTNPVQRRAAMLLSRHYRTKLHFRSKLNLAHDERLDLEGAHLPNLDTLRAMSSDNEACMQQRQQQQQQQRRAIMRHLPVGEVGKATSAEHLDPLCCGSGESAALVDMDCISELVREANRLDDSIDAELGSPNREVVYLGFHEKLERHNRLVQSEKHKWTTEADYLAPVPLDNGSTGGGEQASSCSGSGGGKTSTRWPFGQLMRQKSPLSLRGSLFTTSSQQSSPAKSPRKLSNAMGQASQATGGAGSKRTRGSSMAAHQRALNLTRSMTSEIFDSIWRPKGTTQTSRSNNATRDD